MKQCKNCKTAEISDKATYCSDKCRMSYKRNPNKQPEQINPEQPNPNKLTSDISTSDKVGHCKGCGEKQSSNLVDICYKCIANGLTRKSIGLKTTKRQQWINDCHIAPEAIQAS